MTFNGARCTSPVLLLTLGGSEANSAILGKSRKEANTMDGVGMATALASHHPVMDLGYLSLIMPTRKQYTVQQDALRTAIQVDTGMNDRGPTIGLSWEALRASKS